MKKKIRLGVNIDHIATLRNARNENFPDLLKVACLLKKIKVDSITVHLREDRRHIIDLDVFNLKKENLLPLNLEMAATKEMKEICLKVQPYSCCIVPERREELTTEGGLDVKNQKRYLNQFLPQIIKSDIKLSLFIDPEIDQIKAAHDLGVNAVEIHTGKYSRFYKKKNYSSELKRIKKAAEYCLKIGIDCHAGHGLNFKNVSNISSIKNVVELNVGHFLISQSIFDSLEVTVKKFMKIINHPSIS
ncbi:MAG: pyridoxine 5'-phosphate synthase [Pseudomonadota bacterium]|nr:pyridoxine 5'-phosphate synthase [Pseudomonadota bacterium]